MGDSAGLRLLEDVKSLIAQGWSRGADARDADLRPVDPWDATAASWSILGALVAILERRAQTTGELPLEEVAAALYAIAHVVHVDSLEQWNDSFAHSQADVLGALDRAIATYDAPYPHARAS
jgi:hypothetical protein